MHSELSARYFVNRRIETSRNNLSKHDALLEQNMNIVKLRAEVCWHQKARHLAGLFVIQSVEAFD
jgi:hypothetical protein